MPLCIDFMIVVVFRKKTPWGFIIEMRILSMAPCITRSLYHFLNFSMVTTIVIHWGQDIKTLYTQFWKHGQTHLGGGIMWTFPLQEV